MAKGLSESSVEKGRMGARGCNPRRHESRRRGCTRRSRSPGDYHARRVELSVPCAPMRLSRRRCAGYHSRALRIHRSGKGARRVRNGARHSRLSRARRRRCSPPPGDDTHADEIHHGHTPRHRQTRLRESRAAGPLAQLRRAPGGHRDHAGGAPRHFASAGRVRRRRHRAPVHQPARRRPPSLLRDDRGAARIGAFPGPARRRADPVRVVQRARVARRRSRRGGAASAATISRSASSSRARTTSRTRRRNTRCSRGSFAALRRRYPIADIAAHSEIAPGRKSDPGEAFDRARLDRLLARPAR